MRAYTVTLAASQATYLADTVRPAGGHIDITTPTCAFPTVQLDEAAYTTLTGLSEDSDGHIDSEGRIWFDGACDQLTPISL